MRPAGIIQKAGSMTAQAVAYTVDKSPQWKRYRLSWMRNFSRQPAKSPNADRPERPIDFNGILT